MAFSRVLLAIAASIALLGFSIQPARLRTTADKSMIWIGTEINLPPIVRFINVVFQPFARALIPLNAQELKKQAIESFPGDAEEFGAFVHWEAYEKFVETADSQCHLLGRYLIAEAIRSSLRTHLWMTKQVRDHPEILNQAIERPILFAGFTRVGATFIYQVVADTFSDLLLPTRQYEIMGSPFEIEGAYVSRVEQTRKTIAMYEFLNPVLTKLHEWGQPDDMDEEAGWYGLTFCGLASAFTLPSPYHSYQFYDNSCSDLFHPFLKRILQIRQWQNGGSHGKRVVQKSPEHLLVPSKLLRVFPDAAIIPVDRVDVGRKFKSSLAITHHYRQMFVNPRINDTIHYNEVLICNELESIAQATNGSYHVLHLQSPHIFKETFEDVARVAEFAGLPWDDERQERARQVIEERHGWKLAQSAYKVEEYGLTDTLIAEKLAKCNQNPKTYDAWLKRQRKQAH